MPPSMAGRQAGAHALKDSLDGCQLYANEHGIEVVCLHLTALKLVDTGSDSCMLVGRTMS
jgi:hypothetical protein